MNEKNQIGKRKTGSEGRKNENRDKSGLSQSKTKGASHKRSGTRSRSDRGKDTGKKRTGVSIFRGEITTRPHHFCPDLENSEKIQSHYEKKYGERTYEDRVLELESPP
jgi:hypothetical protein